MNGIPSFLALITVLPLICVSQGLNSTYSEETGTFTFLPEYTKIYTSIIEVFWKLDRPITSTGDVSGVCQSTMVTTLEEAKSLKSDPICTILNTTLAPSTTEPGTTLTSDLPIITPSITTSTDKNITTELPSTTSYIPIDLTSPWIIDDDVFQFERGEYYKSVATRRQKPVISHITEFVVIKCCSRPPSINKYMGVSAAMIAEVLLTSACSNCTGGVITEPLTQERSISNPAFVEIAPCSCDRTYQACDIQCCCDQDCTDDMKNTFTSCTSGLLGRLSSSVPDRFCTSRNPFKDDWFPLMCVVFEENSYLGLYHTNQAKITTDQDINSRVNNKKNLFKLRKSERRYTDPNAALTGYVYGADIRTNRADITLSDKGTLTLPQKSAGGSCVRTAPVQFLKDIDTDCVTTVSAETCVINSLLSARVYVEALSVFKPPCPHGFEICEEYGSEVKAPISVNYYCADSAYAKKYLQGSSTIADIILPDVQWVFNSTLANEDCTYPSDNLNCTNYNDNRLVTTVPFPPRCPWDDGYTRAPIPQSSGGNCLNSVLDLRYKFVWKGQKVIQLEADIILGSAPITNSPDVTQAFQVSFVQEMSGSNNGTEVFQRSGNPGYDMGKAIFSGCFNNTALEVDTDSKHQMAIWKPGIDGLCYKAGRQQLLFGEDITSSCILRLRLNDINDCKNLRTLVSNHLNTLMPADVLGRQGYNDLNNQTLWIKVLRQNVSELINTALNASTDDNNTVTSPIDGLKGICRSVPAAIHLDILYGEAGKGNGYPINEILGARIRYSIDDWQMSCSGSNSVRCRNNSNFAQSFILSSSVGFTKMPANTPIKPIKFWAVHTDPSCQTDSCQRYFDNFDTTICHYDTCWNELFYPLSGSYTADSPMYVLAFTLVFVMFILAYYMIGQRHKLAYGVSKDNSLGNIINTFPTECFT